MNMTISTSTPGPAATPLAQGALAAGAATAGAATAAPVAAFADWMGLDLPGAAQETAAPSDGLAADVLAGLDGAPADTQAGSGDAADGGAAAQEQAQPVEELPNLAAMMSAMPLLMPMPMQMPISPVAAAPAPLRGAAESLAVALPAGAAPMPGMAAPQPEAGPIAAPAPAMVASPAAPAATFQMAAASAAPAAAAATAPAAAADAPLAADVTAPLGASAVAPAQPAASASSELKLAAATPAAWQQPLREALGDRLQLQLSRNIDQAVIRLDPPNLGRIEIAIRHMGGNLEVNISATHSEVVRQLNTISETMRTDLAARQFTEVAVNVTTATRAAGSQQAFDQQGRQRQQDGAPDDTEPGRALAEAGHPSSTFSLNGRESTV